MYADIIIDISRNELDKTFQYRVPEALEKTAVPGAPVVVPFGSRKISGFIVGLSETPKIDESRIKDILSIPEKSEKVEGHLIALAAWMAEHYGSTLNQALKTVLPIKKKEAPKEKKTIVLNVPLEKAKAEYIDFVSRKRHSVPKERLFSAILENNMIPWDFAVQKLAIPSTAIRDLEKKAIVRIETSRDYRNPVKAEGQTNAAGNIILNEEQEKAYNAFASDWDEGLRKTYLLYGVTGSGKTEVYIRMIEKALSEGRQAIVLIPEIALTYQTLMRFYSRFGDKVSVIHSRLTPGERTDQFDRAKAGEISIMIGPRSALFTPFPDTGIIIIDEEQENAYKSEQAPRYHARETAEKLASLTGSALVLGSATPSLEAMAKAKAGEYTLLTMEHRVSERPLAKATVVDMREELKKGNRSVLSRPLEAALNDRLARHEQAMLFLNRRGMMGFISCRSCGAVIKCPHCDVSLSLHRDGRLHCHYCGYSQENVKACPACGSKYIGSFKAGTEKVEEFLQQKYPAARILRMDADTTKGKEGHEAILSAFANREADILLGTQMIVKGHDFADVTLMGILAADMSLNASDFRSGERTFDLLTQAAGRAGRGTSPGEVIIQTYQPENYAIAAAAAQDYERFFKEESSFRRLMKYPPYSHMLQVQLLGADRQKLAAGAQALYGLMAASDATLFLMKPTDARIAKINDVYRMVIYAKDDDYERLVALKDAVVVSLQERRELARYGMTVFFDFDPMGGF